MPFPVESETALHRIPFASLDSFPPLYEQYCTDYPAVAEFFAGDFRSVEDRASAATRAAEHPRDRDALAEILLEQNERWGISDRTRYHIELLRRPESVAVVTGQQVGLLSGPLYTSYKTITALQLAAQLAQETGRPVVPVFWLEGEDHDFDEIAEVNLLQDGGITSVRYAPDNLPKEGNPGPVGRLLLTEQIQEVLDQADQALPPTDFKAQVMQAIREAYQPGTTLLDAFARLMNVLFPEAGLILVDPGDPRLKRLAAQLFQQEIDGGGEAERRIQDVSDRLRERFHAQVNPRSINLFLTTEQGRFPIDAQNGTFQVRGTGETFTREQLTELLETSPERFSPNVVFRPLMQDLLFPTAAYAGGPGEISYFAQFKPVYEWAGIPMPVIYPRASVTLVEGRVQKVLDRYSLSLSDLEGDLEQLFRRIVVERMDVDVEAVFQQAARKVQQAIDDLKASVETVDKTLGGSAEATRTAILKELEKLENRVVKAGKRNQEEVRGQIEKARLNLFPNDKLQERALSPLYFLNKYGLDLISRLQNGLSLDTAEHQVLTL